MTATRLKLAAFALIFACGGGDALAAPPGATDATLAVAPPIPVHRMIDGRSWDCRDMACAAGATANAESQSISRECNRAARELGAFSAYQTGARSLTPAELAKCNSGAKFLANG